MAMDQAHVNRLIQQEAPAAWRCLSPLGREAVFPRGILAQTAEASHCALKATIGQITDGAGEPLPLPAMANAIPGLDPRVAFLYSPQEGWPELRQAWSKRQHSLSLGSQAPVSLPMVVHGLTHGLGLIADLFADEDTEILIPSPFWGNYRLVFTLRNRARVRLFPFFSADGFNVQGLADALEKVRGKKAVLILNIPGNPTGYTPKAAIADVITRIVTEHDGPLVAVVDDAYQGMLWEDGLLRRSLYWDIAAAADPDKLHVVKLDGATKEFFFFPSRVGFYTHSAAGEVQAAFDSKLKCLGRSTVGSPPGPSQALLLHVLSQDYQPQLDQNLQILRSRYRTLKDELKRLDNPWVYPYPFNSGMFALIGLDPSVSPEHVRHTLIEEHSAGVISIPEINGIRLSYGAIDSSDLPKLIHAIDVAVRPH